MKLLNWYLIVLCCFLIPKCFCRPFQNFEEMADCIPNKCNLIINYLPQTLLDSEFSDLFESIGKTTYTRIIRDKISNYR